MYNCTSTCYNIVQVHVLHIHYSNHFYIITGCLLLPRINTMENLILYHNFFKLFISGVKTAVYYLILYM